MKKSKEKSLTIKKILTGVRNEYYYFKENDYVVRYNHDEQSIHCTCYNGSNFGVNNKQICKHKKYVLEYKKNGKQ
jgi:hypothetical protein